MEHKAAKIGTAFAAAVLGLGLPALASAQEYPNGDEQQPDVSSTSTMMVEDVNAPEMAPLTDAMAMLADRTHALADMGPISADAIAAVSLSDIGLTAEQRYTLMQNADASNEAALQQTLGTVMVDETGMLGGYQRTLADHLKMLGVDPASVIALDIDGDGSVTLYYTIVRAALRTRKNGAFRRPVLLVWRETHAGYTVAMTASGSGETA
jgi:hypothetical protein